MVLPLLVAIIIAKWIADAVSHSLYHAILEVKCVPILHSNPQSGVSLDLIPVHHVMAYPVVTFQEQMPLTKVREILRDTRHNGFPVVRNTPQGQVSASSGMQQLAVACNSWQWLATPVAVNLVCFGPAVSPEFVA